MCIAISKPAGKIISEEILRNCFVANPDGAGFAVKGATEGEVDVYKGYMTFQSFYEAFKPFQEQAAIIHFRIATHGSVKPENCHPFMVNNGLAFIHNGIINNVTGKVNHLEDEVDTNAFNRLYLQHLPDRFYRDRVLCDLVGNYIGYSKLAFINAQGELSIINEEKGEWSDGVWYSNTSFRGRPKTTYPINQWKNHGAPSTPPKTNNPPAIEGEKVIRPAESEGSNIIALRNQTEIERMPLLGDWVKLTRHIHAGLVGSQYKVHKKWRKGTYGEITGFGVGAAMIIKMSDDREYIIPNYAVKVVSNGVLPIEYQDEGSNELLNHYRGLDH